MKAAVLTISDGVSAGERGGRERRAPRRAARGGELRGRAPASFRTSACRSLPRFASSRSRSHVILTTGGTGVSPRDFTPEATPVGSGPGGPRDRRGVARGRNPADAARAARPRHWPAFGDRRLIVNLPGSPGGCRDGFALIKPALSHAVELIAGGRSRAPADMSATVALPRRFASLVKIEHTVFALPFAYIGALLCLNRVPSAHDLVWITLAMVGARSLAMGLNRLIDARDRCAQSAHRRPRAAGGTALACSGDRLSARSRSRSISCRASSSTRSCAGCGRSRVVGFVVYPYLKRFTWLSHIWLGAVDGLAPMGAWVAITGRLPWEAWALGGCRRGVDRRLRSLLLAVRP